MTWTDFYLFCFLFGFFFSLASLFSGHLHVHGGHGHDHLHFDHGHGHGADHHASAGERPGLSPLNMGTLSAFLAWFGGTGYLATHFYRVWFLSALGLSLVAGLTGASIVFWFVSKILMREREELDPAAYEMVGVLGTVSGALRPGGTGEMIFSQHGVRRASPVRSEDGAAIPTGVEVVVTSYRDGIAYVRRWDEVTGAQ
jgi:membrane protein implicated in regulation of membrane protease activity